MSNFARLLSYVRRAPHHYLAGGLLTLAYAILFPLVPLASRRVIQRIETGAGLSAVGDAAGLLIGLGIVVALARFTSRFFLFRAARQIEYDVRSDLCEHLQRLPQSYFAEHRTGDLMSRAVNDVNSLRMFLGMGVMNLAQTPVLYVTTISAMLLLDWWVALCVLIPYIGFVGVARLFGRHLHAANLDVQEQLGTLSAVVQENAAGVLVALPVSHSHPVGDAEASSTSLDRHPLHPSPEVPVDGRSDPP